MLAFILSASLINNLQIYAESALPNGYFHPNSLFNTYQIRDLLMSVQATIESKLTDQLSPRVIAVENESHKHSRGENSHFKLTVVSDVFAGLRAVQRHQKVYGVLSAELESGVHALAIHAYTPEEWESRGNEVPESPNCLGGSKHDK